MEECIDPRRLLSALSICLDFSREGLGRHHQQVAYTALCIARELGLSEEEEELVFTAAIVHDAGVRTWHEKAMLMSLEVEQPWDHCRTGSELVRQVDLLHPVAEVICCHHDRFQGRNESGRAGGDIPLAARIIHLADRVDVLLKPNLHILKQYDVVSSAIHKLAGQVFDPNLVSVFMELAGKESFWLDLTTPFLPCRGEEGYTGAMQNCFTEKNLLQIAELFASVIDRSSAFTHRHSRGVAFVASKLAEVMGFPHEQITMMKVAGLLHDVGKLSVPGEILEKPSGLTAEEFAVVRQHTYFTYWILRKAGVPSPIPDWAAYHHERLDGNGYPFHLGGKALAAGARIMSVADVFTALREDRPYRPGMHRDRVERILLEKASEKALDSEVVHALFDIYDDAANLNEYAQSFSTDAVAPSRAFP